VSSGNPWLSILLADYEGHMALPAVGQAHMIAEQFDRALRRWAPARIAVIGCAGGNGLDRIEPSTVERVVAVDLNPEYIECARARDVLSTFKTLARNSRPDAVLTTVLQLPHSTMPAVSASPYVSLSSLATAMTLVAPESLCQSGAAVGFAAADSTTIELASGKRFCVQTFTGPRRPDSAGATDGGNKSAGSRVLPG
jgi:hypothetical protein